MVSCYQDENGNGKLDMGITGPKEPWEVVNMRKKPAFGKPSYKEVALSVRKDVTNIKLVVN